MKAGWQTKKLGEICDIERGGSPRPIQDFITADPNGINWIKIGDATASGKYIYKTEEKIKPEGAKRSRMVYEGDFILSNSMSFGRPYIMRTTGCIHDGWLVLHQPKVDPDYLYYVLSSDLIFDQFDRLASGSTVRNLNIGLAKSVEIPYPPLPEQQRIVGILDEAFDGIATAKANAEQNLQNARALFESHLQSVFTQRSLSNAEGRGEGWVEKSVGELVDEGVLVKPFDGNHGEIHPTRADYTESGIPFIMASDLKNGGVDTVHCKFISRKLADSLRVGFAKDRDVLISHKGTIGRSAIVSTADDYIMLTPQVTSYRIKDQSKLLNRFVRYYFMSSEFQRQIIDGAADGSTRAYIGITKQLNLRFRFPLLDEQHQIVEKLDELVPETQRLESLYQRKLAALDELKKSLLHQAFSGAL